MLGAGRKIGGNVPPVLSPPPVPIRAEAVIGG
jgi:hypothetical protein